MILKMSNKNKYIKQQINSNKLFNDHFNWLIKMDYRFLEPQQVRIRNKKKSYF